MEGTIVKTNNWVLRVSVMSSRAEKNGVCTCGLLCGALDWIVVARLCVCASVFSFRPVLQIGRSTTLKFVCDVVSKFRVSVGQAGPLQVQCPALTSALPQRGVACHCQAVVPSSQPAWLDDWASN